MEWKKDRVGYCISSGPRQKTPGQYMEKRGEHSGNKTYNRNTRNGWDLYIKGNNRSGMGPGSYKSNRQSAIGSSVGATQPGSGGAGHVNYDMCDYVCATKQGL